MRVETFLSASAARRPDKVALVAGERRLTWRDLDRASDRLAGALAAHGIRRGDRVVVFMDNCAEAVVAIFAILKAGGVFSPIHPSTKADKLAYVLNNCRAAGLVTLGRLARVAAAALAQAPAVGTVMVAEPRDGAPPSWLRYDAALSADAAPPPAPGIALDLAMLIYTSGTTGRPKGVMMTHQNMLAAAGAVAACIDSREDDVILSVLPLSFNYGLYQVFLAARSGATLVLEKSFAFPQAVVQRIAAERATVFPLVPTIAALLLQLKDLKTGDLPTLRTFTNTAAALPIGHILRLRTLFPAARLHSMYGLTECKRCTWLPPDELMRRPDSVGVALPGTEVWVADETGAPLPPGEVGELVVRGPHVMQGYWDDPAATARALRPGPYPWERVLHTGDLFRADAEGFFYFVARKDDIIKSRGEKVSPQEVERALHALPGVREAAVLGVDDPILGQAVKAIVVAAPGALTAQDVIRHCARVLEDVMVPKHVEFRDALPKLDNGKIDRRALAAPLMDAAE
ncbi:class I adenylate-forming enzyme family protein [Rhodoplanes sp. TEM]|uniref:Class I adenylate-forming enzyme family protein n=1 Tax=Rhodoplanes tepidamans TaxID=200616 RepID=A0ABT5J9W7_RHOTP|nr:MULTISPECIES: class I adenylate-forming enzyme family protein [Rhodoplanes]MDC7786460.1 class I adenylate-forming enzyme family protein [Rhodoplanes tepidamans]MDC7985102.1 class I adenylate-forming enzyme family protein [Rhodoplanes sp. TEM]MDQ0357345.1 amino acid adenylation domain-containing protein [Rhodoplanes tepidamans]